MEENRTPKISLKYSASDFKNLNLKINSDSATWEKAISIFEDRFNERFWEPLDLLLKNPKQYGFAIMALNCLLIDTFIQFEKGKDRIDEGQLNTEYPKFLVNKFPEPFDENKAKRFYYDIRCGILHSAQTKQGSRLSVDDKKIISLRGGEYRNYQDKQYICVNVIKFTEMLKKYYQSYLKELKSSKRSVREAFINKMNYLISDMER